MIDAEQHAGMDATAGPLKQIEQKTSRIPRFYRLNVEQRLAHLARNFGLSNNEIAQLREGKTLRIRDAVNMVENAIGVFSLPLGLGLNFLVDGRDYLAPMAIEEASIIAAASKSALLIRQGGGFVTNVDDPVMIGQVQILELADPAAAAETILKQKQQVLDAANLPNQRMVARGGGAFDVECRIVDGTDAASRMLVVHLLINVQEAMGANAVNYACEAAGPVLEELSGGRVNLRILSNLADRRLARSRFRLPLSKLALEGLSGQQVAEGLLEAWQFAWADPYRAATHNKGIFNGMCAAALALGQDWRAIEAGGHAFAARDGQYRSLTRYWLEGDDLVGEIELPLQVGIVGGASSSHKGVKLLRGISGVNDSRELAGLLASVGLASNFGACLALSTVGIQHGHMALHARSVAISVGVAAADVEYVAQEMIKRGEVKIAAAEEIYRKYKRVRDDQPLKEQLPIESFAPGKVVLFGEHAVVYGHPGITSTIDIGITVRISADPHGPRFLQPTFKQPFAAETSDQDLARFGRAVNEALAIHDLERAPIAIEIESDLIPGMGLGSSAAFSTALLTALRHYRQLSSERKYETDLFEEVQRLEAIFHGSPSGMDAATVLSGGALWFRKGPPREVLPIRIPRQLAGVICVVEPGARTIELVERVRQAREISPKRVDLILEEIGTVTTQAGIALGSGDLKEAGELMSNNHELLSRLGVSTDKLDAAVGFLIERGALGAKLTGAGGGGAVIALLKPEHRFALEKDLREAFPVVMPFYIGGQA